MQYKNMAMNMDMKEVEKMEKQQEWKKEKKKNVKKLLEMGINLTDIEKITELSEKEIQQLKKQLYANLYSYSTADLELTQKMIIPLTSEQ